MQWNHVMQSVVFFTDISRPEVVFLNKVHHRLNQRGLILRAIVFRDYDNSRKKLQCDYIYLKTFNLFQTDFSWGIRGDSSIYDNDLLEKLIPLEKEISPHLEIDIHSYKHKLNNLAGFVKSVTTGAIACFVMSRPYTSYKVVRSVLTKTKAGFVFFEKWVFAGSYQFNRHGIEQPRLDSNLRVDNEQRYRLLLDKLLSNYKGRHPVSEDKAPLPGKFVLLLLGDGHGGSFSLKNTDEYWTVGKGWGNDFEVLSKVESCVAEKLPDHKLLVRQHPYTKYRIDKEDIHSSNTILVNRAELDSLISDADVIITVTGSIMYYALAKGKKAIVLGNMELCGTEAVICLASESELKSCLAEVSQNKDVLYITRKKVIESTLDFFKNQVWVNDEAFTYRVLDKYMDVRKPRENNAATWRMAKRRILKHNAYTYIKDSLRTVLRKVGMRSNARLGEQKTGKTEADRCQS